ncbi:MAG: HEAT repeat domain-containing protein, partial [bacterium]|nr:HEAT repeat domain-containing protein [bacterium]
RKPQSIRTLKVKRKVCLSLFIFFLLALQAAAEKEGTERIEDRTKRITKLVDQLNSTVPVTEQNFARNSLIKMGPSVLPYLEDRIRNDKRTYVRVQIAFLLGRIKDVSSLSVLEETAGSPYYALNKACVLSIGQIGGKKSVDALKRIKERTKDPNLIKVIKDIPAGKSGR